MPTQEPQETKQSLRKRLQETRRNTKLSDFDIDQLTKRGLFELSKTSGDVCIYMSLPEEPPTKDLITEVRKLGRNVWLPRINGDDLLWIKNPDSFAQGPFGIKEPVGEGVLAKEIKNLGAVFCRALQLMLTAQD